VDHWFGENVQGVKLQLDPGLRAGVSGGYLVTPWFAPEFELGLMINEVDSITGPAFADEVTLSQFPFLVNAKFLIPNRSIVTPYAGIGAGGSATFFDADYIRIGNTSLSGEDSDVVFAWQAFAGLRFALNEQMGLGLEYRYFQAEGASWEADFVGPSFDDEFGLGRSSIHTVSLTFEFRF
jgi:opacity protein-like surface antigen